MDYKSLILNSLLLLYWESQNPINSGVGRDAVKSIMKDFRLPKQTTDTETTQEIMSNLYTLVCRLLQETNIKIDKVYVLQRVKLACMEETYHYDIVEEGINRDLGESGISDYCALLLRDLEQYKAKKEFAKKLQELNKRVNHTDLDYNLTELVKTFTTQIEPYMVEESNHISGLRAIEDYASTDDPESMVTILKKATKEINPDHVFKFGWQGLNRMFGTQGGARRGECIVTSGLSHHGKSLITLAMFRSMGMYNTPKDVIPGMRPALVYISSEDALTIGIRKLYQQTYANVYGKKIDTKDIDPAQAAGFLIDEFKKNGWTLIFFRVDPNQFDRIALVNFVNKLMADGYQIFGMCLDYLGMCSTKGFEHAKAMGQDVQAYLKFARALNVKHNYVFITPHQLSTQALEIWREDKYNFLRTIQDGNYYHGCRSYAQEPDGEVYVQKYVDPKTGEVYFGMCRGKHRGVEDTPEDHKICWYLFTPLGVPDDLHTEPQFLSKPSLGAGVGGIGGGIDIFSNEVFV